MAWGGLLYKTQNSVGTGSILRHANPQTHLTVYFPRISFDEKPISSKIIYYLFTYLFLYNLLMELLVIAIIV